MKVFEKFKRLICDNKNGAPVSLVLSKAFTLAEVLITLSIIGVVAALTIPALIQKQQEIETVSKLKKVYSTLSNAYTLAVDENGTPENWGGINDDGAASKEILDKLIPYLKIQRNCGTSSGCMAPKYVGLAGFPDDYGSINSSPFSSKILLQDGTAIALDVSGTIEGRRASGRNAFMLVDLNGSKNPNRIGVDAFIFTLWQTRILPEGMIYPPYTYSFPNICNARADASVTSNGRGCTGWVIYNENMDYLHCVDLSWNGKKKCD